MKNVAAALGRLGAEGAAVLAADAALFAQIEEVPRSAWLPVDLNVRWVEATAHVFGWPQALDFLAARVSDQFESPLFRSFVQGGIRVLGLDPGALVRLIPRGLTLVFRDCGEWTAARTSASSSELRVKGLPAALAREGRWIESIGGSALAMLRLSRTPGRVWLAEHHAGRGEAVIAATWQAKATR